MFGRSFNAFIEASNKRKIVIDDLFTINGVSLKDAKKQAGSFWSYLYPKKEDIKSQLIDVDVLIPEIDENKASKILETIKSIENGTNEEIKTFQALYDTGNKTNQWIAEYAQSTKDQIRSTEGVIKANQKAREAAIAHNAALKQQTLGAKAAAIGMKALAMAGNMIAFLGITKVIEWTVKSIDDLVHSAEHCKERVDELMSSYQSALDKANSNAKTVEDLASRYEELSKGVNNLGQNVSLTTDEYSEYNNIVNQIADMFPTLVQGYTDEGNAILSLKGNVEQLRDAYKEAQQEAYNMLIASGKDSDGNDIVKNANNVITGSTFGSHDWGNAEKIDYLDKLMNATDSVDSMLDLWDESLNSAYSDWFEDFTGVGGIANIGKLTDDDLADIRKNAKILKQQYQAEIDSAVDDVETLANAYLMTNEDYAKLDEQSKNAASIMVNSLNANIVSKFGKDKENVGKYVDDIVQIISSNPDAKGALVGLFTLDTTDLSPTETNQLVNQYINYIAGVLKENPVDLKVRLGFDDVSELAKDYQQIIQEAAAKSIGQDYGFNKQSVSREDMAKYDRVFHEYETVANELGIDTQEEIDRWREVCRETENATEAKNKYVQASALNDKSSMPFLDVFNSVAFTEAKEKLLNLSTAGELTEETLSSTEEYKTLLDQTGLSASQLVEEINKFNLQDLNTNYEYFLELLNRVCNGEELNFDEATKLIAANEELADQVIITANGYSFEEDAVISLTNKYAEASNTAISNQIETTKRTVEEIKKRIKAYQTENETLLSSGIAKAVTKTGKNYSALEALGYSKEDVDKYYNYLFDRGKLLNAQEDLAELLYGNLKDPLKETIDKSSGSGSSGSNSSSDTKDFKESIDWIEVSITRATEALEKFTKARENAFDTYSSRDSALLDEINQTKELLSLQEKAAKKYREHAESIALSEDYKKKVQDGTIYIEPITDESSKKLIDEYTEWYNKSVEAEKQVRSLQLSLSELAKTKFDLITSQFDNVISAFETRANSINKAIELTEAKGYAVSTRYYESLIGEETENIRLLEAKRNELQKSLNEAVSSGAVKEASEEWYGMYSSISDVNAELEDANISLVEFSNTIRQLQWDKFDRLQDAISQITDESDFLMSLFENSDMFVKGGYITKDGLVTAGQHAVNYNTLMRQADEYGNEYRSVMEDLAKDKNNQTLIDRTRELAQAQRDAIQSANDEKQALIELAREGIEKEIEAMQELVDIKKKSLDEDYELYQRQQDLAEQSDELALLYKQQAAIQGDDSEGNMKRLQEVNEQIAEAEKQLQETEYDNWKTAQQNMLDNMMSEYEETQNERMQQTEQLFNDMINIVNSHSSLINDTIYDAATDVGYQISSEMSSIWANNGEYQNTVSNYVNGADNRVNAVIEGINEQQKEQQRILDNNATNTINNIQTIGTKVDELKDALLGAINGLNKPSATPTTQQQPTQSQTSSSSTTSGSTPNVGSGGGNNTPEVGDHVYASGRWYTSSTGNEAGIDLSELVGKIDYFKIEMVREGAKHPYWIQAYNNNVAQGGNGWVDLDQLAGYKNGIRKVHNKQLAWTNEDGTEGVYRASDGAILEPVNPGDMIFSNEQMQRLWDISKNGVLPNVKLPSVNLPQVKGNSVSIGDVKQEVHINLPNVKDPSSFREAIKSDKALRQQIKSLVLDPLTGRSSFGYKKY